MGFWFDLLRRAPAELVRAPGRAVRLLPQLMSSAGRTDLARQIGRDPLVFGRGVVPYVDALPYCRAPSVERDPSPRPRLNVLLPVLRPNGLSGGPNTAMLVATALLPDDWELRFVATDGPCERLDAVRRHYADLVGDAAARATPEFVWMDRTRPFLVRDHDAFLATSWWTAHIADGITRAVDARPFGYLVQDFEPGLYAWSIEYAAALASHSFDTFPLVNERTLLDHLIAHRIGRFADPDFVAGRCAHFEPAVDRQYFHPTPRTAGLRRRCLFYARPSAPRNLYHLGLAALQAAVASGALRADEWELRSIGDPLPTIDLGQGQRLEPMPWMAFGEYAATMRSADLGLSLMLSPHTSYPPLEMAACGMQVVTNSYDTKTTAALRALARNIHAAPADPASIAAALIAASRISERETQRTQPLDCRIPSSWQSALAPVVAPMRRALAQCANSPAPRA